MPKILIANWKMNPNNLADATKLWQDYQQFQIHPEIWSQVIACCPTIFLGFLETSKTISLGVQDVSEQESGAFTGQISAKMINSLGINQVLIGHSETRDKLGYTNSAIAGKVNQAISNNLQPIICIGYEPDSTSGSTNLDILKGQITTSLQKIDLEKVEKNLLPIFAFEPIWAIGTGLTPTMDQIEELTRFIKDIIMQTFNLALPVLYGGSVSDKNIVELYAIENVDGFLVGGASLKSEVMTKIVQLDRI